MKYLKVFIFLLFITPVSYGQFTQIDCNITKAYIAQNIGGFSVYIHQLDEEIAKNDNNNLRFKRLKLRHLYIAHLLFTEAKSDSVEAELKLFEKDLIVLEKNQIYAPLCGGFRAAYTAYVALENPTTAIYYLPKSFSLAKDAIKKYENSAYSWSEYGNLEYCYSLFLGGDFSEAIKAFTKAVELMEKQEIDKPCNWYYINTLLFLAKSYEDNKQYKEANQVYDKILLLTPEFTAINRWKHKF